MNVKLFLILLFTALIVVGCSIKTGKVNVQKKRAGMTLYMEELKDKLTVSEAGNTRKELGKIDKIFYNNKNYTSYAKELIDSRPMVFASPRFLIFGEGEVCLKSSVWKCPAGIVFIPGGKDVSFMEAKQISYHEEKEILKGENVILRKISLEGKEKEEHKSGNISIDFKTK
jgi:hypothetical protein